MTILVELGAGRIETNIHLATRLEARLLDRLEDHLDCRLIGGEVGGKTTLITHRGVHPLCRQYPLQRMEHLGTVADRLGNGICTHRQNHELLQIDTVVGVLTTIDDVHHRYWHLVGGIWSEVTVERSLLLIGCGMSRSHRYRQQRIGAQAPLVLGAIQIDHDLVHLLLGSHILALQRIVDLAIDVGNRLQHPLATVTALVTITQLNRFTRAGRGTGGDRSAPHRTGGGGYIDFNRGISTGINNLASYDLANL